MSTSIPGDTKRVPRASKLISAWDVIVPKPIDTCSIKSRKQNKVHDRETGKKTEIIQLQDVLQLAKHHRMRLRCTFPRHQIPTRSSGKINLIIFKWNREIILSVFFSFFSFRKYVHSLQNQQNLRERENFTIILSKIIFSVISLFIISFFTIISIHEILSPPFSHLPHNRGHNRLLYSLSYLS